MYIKNAKYKRFVYYGKLKKDLAIAYVKNFCSVTDKVIIFCGDLIFFLIFFSYNKEERRCWQDGEQH